MNLLSNVKYYIFKFSPYLVALGTTVFWMHYHSDFHAAGKRVVEYHVLLHAMFSVFLVILMTGAVKSTADHLKASRQHDYSAAWRQRTPPGNLGNWQQFLHEAGYAQLALMAISGTFVLLCVGVKLFNYRVYSDNNFFNFFILLESYFTVLAFCFYCQSERIATILLKFQVPTAGPEAS